MGRANSRGLFKFIEKAEENKVQFQSGFKYLKVLLDIGYLL
jgi:hypothetical protein